MKTWQGSLGVSDFDGIVSPAYFVGRRVGVVDDRFMHHLLRSGPLIAEYAARSKGIRPSQWDLPWDEFASIKVRLPDVADQRAIADYLDAETARIDALIAKKARLVSVLGERSERAVDAIALPHGRPNDRRNPTDLPADGEIPTHWRVDSLGTLLRRITYGFTNPMRTE